MEKNLHVLSQALLCDDCARVGVDQTQKTSRLFTGQDLARGSGQELFTTRGSSRVGSGGDRNLTGWVGSDQEGFKHHGSGRVTLIRPNPRELTDREKP